MKDIQKILRDSAGGSVFALKLPVTAFIHTDNILFRWPNEKKKTQLVRNFVIKDFLSAFLHCYELEVQTGKCFPASNQIKYNDGKKLQLGDKI